MTEQPDLLSDSPAPSPRDRPAGKLPEREEARQSPHSNWLV